MATDITYPREALFTRLEAVPPEKLTDIPFPLTAVGTFILDTLAPLLTGEFGTLTDFFYQGRQAMVVQDYGTAGLRFRDVVYLDPSVSAAWCGLGFATKEFEQYAEALQFFDLSLELEPDWLNPWYGKAMVLGKLGRREESLVCHETVRRFTPEGFAHWVMRGSSSIQVGDIQEAFDSYKKALGYNPRSWEVWYNLGIVYMGLKQPQNALYIFQHIYSMDPDFDFEGRKAPYPPCIRFF